MSTIFCCDGICTCPDCGPARDRIKELEEQVTEPNREFARLWLKHEWSRGDEDDPQCQECFAFKYATPVDIGSPMYPAPPIPRRVGHRDDCAIDLAFKQAGLR